jgi:glucuronate isomerase
MRQAGQPEFRPRALFERFNIEVLCTTDGAADAGLAQGHPRLGWPASSGPPSAPTR